MANCEAMTVFLRWGKGTHCMKARPPLHEETHCMRARPPSVAALVGVAIHREPVQPAPNREGLAMHLLLVPQVHHGED